jgi:hypothetical protein
MKNHLILRSAACALLLGAAPLAAQERDMGGVAPLKATVRVTSASLLGDTTTVTYVVGNEPVSGEALWVLLVDTPSPALRVEKPDAPRWFTNNRYRNRPTARWALHANVLTAPGQSTPPLRFAAVGLADTVRYWAVPDLDAHPPIDEEEPEGVKLDPLKSYSDSGMTVGVTAIAPGTTPLNLVTRLRRLVDFSCGAPQWITSPTTCNTMRSYLDQATTYLQANAKKEARREIDRFNQQLTARRGVSDNAYWLLRGNVDYLLRQL